MADISKLEIYVSDVIVCGLFKDSLQICYRLDGTNNKVDYLNGPILMQVSMHTNKIYVIIRWV
ncbi:protein of unknown function [Candidatus Nitrosocosmicus franklandus]|uniref:Uncharacterized protein n=1 Tax=Candidatus Nitrosocosmicus franklandianus TaxID=1798806 RepID=A0A484ICD4_9ARCH|nr:protein of unknown function [Candidatus Nitrosocosmicus franklandus]